MATGGIMGYFTTYDDTADYDNETFRKTLLDANSWAGTAQSDQAMRPAIRNWN